MQHLGKRRGKLLNQLREHTAGANTQDIQSTVALLTNEQIQILAAFLESGGWSKQLPPETILLLKEIVQTRRQVFEATAA